MWKEPTQLAKFTRTHCGASQVHSSRSKVRPRPDVPADVWFGHEQLLHVPCCGHTLVAFNERHLDSLESFFRAKLRERRRDPKDGWRNKFLASRPPKWLQSAKNRDAVLRGVGELRWRLRTGGKPMER